MDVTPANGEGRTPRSVSYDILDAEPADTAGRQMGGGSVATLR